MLQQNFRLGLAGRVATVTDSDRSTLVHQTCYLLADLQLEPGNTFPVQIVKYVQRERADTHTPFPDTAASFRLDPLCVLVVAVRRRRRHAGTCFHVLTKAVGIREYGTVVMEFQLSVMGS